MNLDNDEKFIKNSLKLNIYETKTIPEKFPSPKVKNKDKKFKKVIIEDTHSIPENSIIVTSLDQVETQIKNIKPKNLKKFSLSTWLK